MDTKVFDVSDIRITKGDGELLPVMSKETREALEFAAGKLREGGTVAFPTETVYGLGGNAFNESALRLIFDAKGRPQDNPLIVHIADADDIRTLASKIPAKAQTLMDAFWPGPLTIVLPKRPEVPFTATGGLLTVAVRMPREPIAAQLIKLSGVPVAAPSANLSGRPSPTSAGHVIEDLLGRVDVILAGKDTDIGIESTVVDMTRDTPVILRPGIITKEEIEAVVGPVETDKALHCRSKKDFDKTVSDKPEAPSSPGVKYTHYAPKAHMTIISSDSDEKKISKIRELIIGAENISAGIASQKTALIISKELERELIKPGIKRESLGRIYTYGSRRRPEQAARSLFKILRECDKEEIAFIIAEALTEEGTGFAVMNRMLKSAGYNLVNV